MIRAYLVIYPEGDGTMSSIQNIFNFFTVNAYCGYVIILFLFSGITAEIAVCQNSADSVDLHLTAESAAERVYAQAASQSQIPDSPIKLLPHRKHTASVISSGSYRTQARYLIRNGLLSDAVELYKMELRSSPDDPLMLREFESLKKAIRLTAALEQTEDSIQWRLTALQLCNYYRDNEANKDYLATALLIFQKSQEQTDVSRILDAYQRSRRYDDAIYFLDALNMPDDLIKMEKASVYIAADDISKARTLVRSVQVKQLCSPEELMRLARLQAATGLQASAVKTLTRCFESAPEQMLVKMKREALDCSDFDTIEDSPEFKSAMKTESLAGTAGYTPPCARKWVGVKIDETPQYIRNFKSKEINFGDWKVSQ